MRPLGMICSLSIIVISWPLFFARGCGQGTPPPEKSTVIIDLSPLNYVPPGADFVKMRVTFIMADGRFFSELFSFTPPSPKTGVRVNRMVAGALKHLGWNHTSGTETITVFAGLDAKGQPSRITEVRISSLGDFPLEFVPTVVASDNVKVIRDADAPRKLAPGNGPPAKQKACTVIDFSPLARTTGTGPLRLRFRFEAHDGTVYDNGMFCIAAAREQRGHPRLFPRYFSNRSEESAPLATCGALAASQNRSAGSNENRPNKNMDVPFVFPSTSLEMNGAWSVELTFTVSRNGSGQVAGNGGSTSSSPANLYVHLEGLSGSNYDDISNRIQVSPAAQ